MQARLFDDMNLLLGVYEGLFQDYANSYDNERYEGESRWLLVECHEAYGLYVSIVRACEAQCSHIAVSQVAGPPPFACSCVCKYTCTCVLPAPSLPVDPSKIDLPLPVDPSKVDLSLSVDPSKIDLPLPVDPSKADLSISVDPSKVDLSISVDPSKIDLPLSVDPSKIDPPLPPAEEFWDLVDNLATPELIIAFCTSPRKPPPPVVTNKLQKPASFGLCF